MTYSIVARDPAAGQLGVGVASHVLAVGAVCPWVEPGVGAVATQAFLEVSYGPRLLSALRQGVAPADALRDLTSADTLAPTRQVAVVDASGRLACHDGAQCVPEAGHLQAEGFSCQANMMRDPRVPEAMAAAFAASEGPLTGRILSALDAAESAGGDIRGRQSAAVKVVAEQPEGRIGGWLVDLRVDDHPEPLVELRRLAQLHAAGSPWSADGPDQIAALGRGNPEGWFWRGVTLANEGRIEEARTAFGRAFAVSDDWRQFFWRISALLPKDPEVLERLSS